MLGFLLGTVRMHKSVRRKVQLIAFAVTATLAVAYLINWMSKYEGTTGSNAFERIILSTAHVR